MMPAVATTVTLLSTGFILGLKHAFDADHVAVVSTMVSQSKNLKKSSLLGVMWGVGHTVTLLVVGLAVLLLKITIPVRAALAMEFIVGLVVVYFGFDLLQKIKRGSVHIHRHEHGGTAHTHFHGHELQPSHQHNHRALGVGALHGLAGSAALTILVLTTVQSTWQGLAFILIFGLGSIISMLIISSAIGLPFLMTKKFTRVNTAVQGLAGAISVLVGLLIVYNIGHAFRS